MKIFWLHLVHLEYKKFFNEIKDSQEKLAIFTPNPEILLLAKEDENFRKILEKWDYLVPDWIGIWAGYQILDNGKWKLLNTLLIPYYWVNLFIKRKALYKKYWERIIWSILTRDLVEYANLKWKWVTIIDKFQAPGNWWDNLKIERQKVMARDLKKKYPNSAFHYYIYKEENKDEIIEEINKTDDVYLFSTQWAKVQETTISQILPKLEKIKVAIWVGWSFDYILNFKKRAPKLIVALWLEWLWRLILHPMRMSKRIWRALIVFLYEVIKSKNSSK
ncbi:MAG: glycosyl transferase, WecB/TagA/CpsF family protein [uncultured bacterium (gcode 4)]|uniref:Glycosyl transferase, WecB/TagA/CpsF family protein n=1 Tax=uncultured bacterium (gcode 4) TaxID=1234023 RepID=K2BUH3_9BACT|nr:MAG: glycosyl transferase, WecB/TagA/CpsF family protein [uncultured bacterium (gcode 4)]